MAYHTYESQSIPSTDHTGPYTHHRPHMELPRPLEPRPTLHSSLSESTGMRRRQEVFYSPISTENRSSTQNLPGLKDIFSPGPSSSRSPTHPPWSTRSHSSSHHQSGDNYYSYLGLHPPMVLYPPSEQSTAYQPQQTRPFNVAILDTSPVGRHPPQALPSPHASYPDQGREYHDPRAEMHGQSSTGPYAANGTTSPYASIHHEDMQYRRSTATLEQASSSACAPARTDSSGQYLGVKEVPGQGTFHVYEGGQQIPTQIDGEQVNPQWGLTKANKPRKRLALACLDCREKKIKCEPGVTSCLQCEKAKRTCRRAPALLPQNDGTTNSWQTSTSSTRKSASNSDPTPTTHSEQDTSTKRRTRGNSSPPTVPSKKHRSASPIYTTQSGASVQRDSMGEERPRTPVAVLNSPENAHKGPLSWDEDPYALEPEATLYLLDLYFAHINSGTYCIYPPGHFMYWVKSYPSKCQSERLVLYAMLATASIFDGTLSGFGKVCAQIAGDAVSTQIGKFNISIAHTKMILALYHFAKGAYGLSWDYVGSAICTMSHMHLHSEQGCSDDAESMAQTRVEFAFSREQLAECKRRTFWAAFLMDRYCGSSTCAIKPEDVFVRLPCADDMYERSLPSDAPFFPNDIVDPASSLLTPTSPLSPMAWLALIAGIWGDVVDFAFHASFRPDAAYRQAYESFYNGVWNRMQGWVTRLPEYLQYSEANLEYSIQRGYGGTFVSMHTLYHLVQIRLNRCLRHSVMPEFIGHNIRTAHSHAHQLLREMCAVRTAKRDITTLPGGRSRVFTLSTPFEGHAILNAIDVVGAGGPELGLSASLEEIEGGLACLRELSTFWHTARNQSRACETRYYQIKSILTNGSKSRSGAWLGKNWGLELPVEQEVRVQDDCIYGLGDSPEAIKMYFDAFDDEHGGTRPGALRIA